MKKTQKKDALRNIRKRLVSYLSICLVIMLGLGGFFITRYMSAGINAAATGYYNDHSFKNFELLSSLGINDDDLAQIMETEGVIDAEGVIRTVGTLTKGDLNSSVELISRTERISVPELVEGKMPVAKDECMIGEDLADVKGLKVGDRVKITVSDNSSDKESLLFETEFTITGLMKHPDYFRRKSTDTVVMPWAAFNKEYLGDFQYSHVFVKTEEPENTDIFSDKYFKKTADTKLALEELAEDLEVDSLARTKARLNADIDKEWQKALAELEDAQNEIDENEADLDAELADARKDLEDAQKELDDKVADANRQISDSEKKIRAAEKKIAAGAKKIAAAEKEIKDGRKKLKKIDKKLPEIKKYVNEMLEDYEGQLEDNLETLLQVKKLLSKLDGLDTDSQEFKDAVRDIAEFVYTHEDELKNIQNFCKKDEVMEAAEKLKELTGIDGTGVIKTIRALDVEKFCGDAWDIYDHGGDLKGFVKDVEDLVKTLEEEIKTFKEYKDYIKEYEANRSSLYKKLDNKEKQLNAKKKELAAAKKELAAAKDKLAAAKAQLAAEKRSAQAQIREGWNLYYSKKAEYESQLEEAKALLAENREEAEKKIAELRADVDSLECAWLVLDRRANAGYVDIKSNIRAISAASLIFGILFMLISAIVCFSTLTIIIEEQKKMVGTVKAFGFLKGEILGKYLVFGVTAAIIGCLAGILLALGLSGVVLNAYNNSGMYQFEQVKSVVTPGGTVIACAVMIAVCAIATVIACSDILKSPASILMKGGTAKKTGYRKEKKSSSKRGGSLYSKLIIRNMLDDKVRVIISILIIAFSTFLVGTGISMKLAYDGMTDKQVGDVYKYDVRVDLGESVKNRGREAIGSVLASHGTEYMQASYESHVFRLGDRLDVVNVITGDPDKLNDFFAVKDIKSGEALELPGDGVLVQKKMKESYGFDQGSTISMFSNELTEECEAEIKGVFQNYVGRAVITSPEGYRSIFGDDVSNNCFYVKLCGADLETLEKDLLATGEDVSFDAAESFANKFESVSFLYNIIVYITTGIAILMSFMILSNLANIFLNRKKTELTVMRINGFSIKQTKGYLTRETIVTTAVGVLLGVLVGAFAAPLIIKAMEQPDLQFIRTFHIWAWVIAVALEVLFAVIIYSVVFRKVKDLNFRDVA